MLQEQYFEDYETGTQRQTGGRTITEADIVIQAGQTGDFYPHHMDAEWCKTQPFERRIAHGTLIFSVGVGMTAGVMNPCAFSYGYDRFAVHQAGIHRRYDLLREGYCQRETPRCEAPEPRHRR
jgi:acyl dehydratase